MSARPVRYSRRRGRRRSGRRMPIKKVEQSVPTGGVAPPPVRPPPLWVPPRPPPVPAEDPVEYPSEDGLPMATHIDHAEGMMTCYRMLKHRFRGRRNIYIGIDVLVYYEQGEEGMAVAPDVFVSFGVPMRDRGRYKVWEAGKPPDVVWEFGSPSTAKGDAGEKKKKYLRMGVREYWLVDPLGGYHDPRLQGFELVDGEYVKLPWERRPDGPVTVWSPVLQLEQHFTDGQLRFWDRKTRRYVELPEEERERLQLEAQRARKESDRARKEAESRADGEAQARKEAESRADSEARARKEAESRADSEAQARRAEMQKRKALEAEVAELKANARPPRDPE